MKVLHLPNNIASQVNVTVKALNDIGVSARGVVVSYSVMQDNRYIEAFTISRNKFSIPTLWTWPRFTAAVLKAIRWADVIHWHFNTPVLPFDLDLKYIQSLNKASIVEFWGSDVRVPEIASRDNPYTATMYRTYPELERGAKERSLKTQKRFGGHGFSCLLPDDEMEPYLQKNLFPAIYRSRQRIIISEFSPRFPDPEQKRPVVVHAPSRKEYKGTTIIKRAVEAIKSKHDFDFILLHGYDKLELMRIIQNCDIYIDELVSGTYGLAAIEAMALGKPAIGYIKPSLIASYPQLPLVNANQDNFSQVLEGLLQDGNRRNQIGRLGRTYVEQHHDAHKIARHLVEIYEDLLQKRHGQNA